MKETQPNTLYIIGNGFDLYHKLDTWYSSFGLFLKHNHSEIYDYFLEYFGFPELDEDDAESLKDPLWSEFEANLATLDIDQILSDHSDYAANPGSDDFSDGDWDTIAVYVAKIRDDLTIKMLGLFKEFILNIEFPDKSLVDILSINKNALFFNFNYSKTLEHYYQIPQKQILYIHNRAESEEMLVLGHGMNPQKFRKQDEQPPEGLTFEELDQWRERQADDFDFSIERGRDELIQYFTKSFKATDQIIQNNEGFFQSLKSINKIYVLGHSLAEVDKNYFEKIISSTKGNLVEWIVSYHNPGELEIKKQKLLDLGLKMDQVTLLKMTEIV